MDHTLQPRVVLGIAAHADDLDFGAAGTVAKWTAAGTQVHYLILTDGSKGSVDARVDPAELIKQREAEQRAAAQALGVQAVYFGGFEDGRLENTASVKREVIRVIRQVKPDTVICWDPSFVYSVEHGIINHPDHRAAGQAALDAVYPLARDHLSYPELLAAGYQPHKVTTLLMLNFDAANFAVDISDTLEQKITALSAHASQVGEDQRQLVREQARLLGQRHGLAAAEAFVRLDIRDT